MTTYYHVIAAGGGGDGSGDSWANAMTTAQWITSITGAIGSDNVYYVKGNQTYTFASNMTVTADGTATTPNACIVVKTGTTNEGAAVDFDDWAISDADKATIAATTYTFTFDDYWLVQGFIVTCANSDGLRADTGSTIYNCKSTNTGAATRSALESGGSYTRFINCYAESTNGRGIYVGSGNSTAANCWVTDSPVSIYVNASGFRALNNIIDNATTEGLRLANHSYHTVMNNTFSNCLVGLSATTSPNALVMNNIFHDCTDGAVWTTQTDNNFWLYNNFFGNTDNEDLVATTSPFGDSNLTTEDPDFETDGSDFRLKTGSGCLNAGAPLQYGTS